MAIASAQITILFELSETMLFTVFNI